MANFDAQIQDLVGDGFTDQSAMDNWMNQGAREIISVLPPDLKLRCATVSSWEPDFTMDTKGKVFSVLRSDGTTEQLCRKIPGIYKGRATLSTDIMYYGTSTDPVWLMYENKLEIFPAPDSNGAKVEHITYPTIDASEDSTIDNFPDEAEYLVVLYAAIKAAESLLASEEDIELYSPMAGTLKQDYDKGMQFLISKGAPPAPPPQGG